MSDARERDDSRYGDEPNREGFAGGATTPQVVREPGEDAAERIAVPDDDLTSALSDATSGATRREDGESTEDS